MNTIALEQKLASLSSLPKILTKMQDFLQTETQERIAFREKITEDDKAEFINGKIIMHSPASDGHNESVINIATLGNVFANIKQLGKVRAEKALVEMTRNDYEPDIAFWSKAKSDSIETAQNVNPILDFIAGCFQKKVLNAIE